VTTVITDTLLQYIIRIALILPCTSSIKLILLAVDAWRQIWLGVVAFTCDGVVFVVVIIALQADISTRDAKGFDLSGPMEKVVTKHATACGGCAAFIENSVVVENR